MSEALCPLCGAEPSAGPDLFGPICAVVGPQAVAAALVEAHRSAPRRVALAALGGACAVGDDALAPPDRAVLSVGALVLAGLAPLDALLAATRAALAAADAEARARPDPAHHAHVAAAHAACVVERVATWHDDGDRSPDGPERAWLRLTVAAALERAALALAPRPGLAARLDASRAVARAAFAQVPGLERRRSDLERAAVVSVGLDLDAPARHTIEHQPDLARYVALIALGGAGLGVPCARAVVGVEEGRAVAAWLEES